MPRPAGQRLRPFEMDAAHGIGVDIEPADVRQNRLIAVTRRELAESA